MRAALRNEVRTCGCAFWRPWRDDANPTTLSTTHLYLAFPLLMLALSHSFLVLLPKRSQGFRLHSAVTWSFAPPPPAAPLQGAAAAAAAPAGAAGLGAGNGGAGVQGGGGGGGSMLVENRR